MVDRTSDIAARLRDHGLRVTATRVAVLAEIGRIAGHPDVETVRAAVAARLGTVSTQAVYDTLHALSAAGLLRRIEPAGHPARYETRVGDNHHHLICRDCGTTCDIDCAAGAAPCLHPPDAGDFLIDEAEVIYWGLCPRCRASDPPTKGTP